MLRASLGAALLIGSLVLVRPGEAQTRSIHCDDCHRAQAAQFAASVHNRAIRCQECHGGLILYDVTAEQAREFHIDDPPDPDWQPAPFDHGSLFRGKPVRHDVPTVCGECHSDVQRMNAYGLATDQLSRYRVSGHGRHLYETGDDRVAVCIDCHGVHDILAPDDQHSSTNFRNIPATCGRCHGDEALMSDYELPASIVEQYRESVHGKAVLERGDAGAPHCATCHGSHGAAPPGFSEVGQVCGRCHQQTEQYYAQSVHGRLPKFPGCIGCHAGSDDLRDHGIRRAQVRPEELREIYRAAEDATTSPAELSSEFKSRVTAFTPLRNMQVLCSRCHAVDRTGSHVMFFKASDHDALSRAQAFSDTLSQVELKYAATAERVERLGRGILLVRNEALSADEARTELLALQAQLHTMDPVAVTERAKKLDESCQQIMTALDEKESGLAHRRQALSIVWVYVVVFSFLMYGKYKQLRKRYVQRAEPGRQSGQPVSRRRLLDMGLQALGLVGVTALLWPGVAYVWPARKRGGGDERVTVGSEGDWSPWTSRKVSVHGKPVVVVRTDSGFAAFSLACTHLGCLVHWEESAREFVCPCHAAVFDAAGQVVSGPPPRPLPEYRVSVVQGEVIVMGLAS